VFLEAVRSIEPAVLRTLERVAREVDVDMAERLNDAVRRIFSRVLKELADLDNPMRTAMGSEPGQGALLEEPASGSEAAPAGDEGPGDLDELAPRV